MIDKSKSLPSVDEWLKQAKKDESALQEGMYLVHNGTVRQTPKAKVRQGLDDGSKVKGMFFSYDEVKVNAAIRKTFELDGIFHVRVWLNQGELALGDDIMLVLIGGDIRPHVIDGLQFLVETIKTTCVTEVEKK
ncbi:molybdenum cofactor biosynthesis protein MoaE [Eubacteriaceae bacterium ES2]|nr:molybdenum cofactor biosynthesis protein MoaE [Eubacteriaceae bacterium ES2]